MQDEYYDNRLAILISVLVVIGVAMMIVSW